MNGTARWGFWVFIVVLVVLHFVLRIGLGFAQLAPDLLVVALLLAAREMRAGFAAGLGLLLGILDGAVVPFNLGASALVLTILGFAGGRSRELVAGDSFIFLALYLFAGKWLYDTLLYLVTGDLFRPGASYLLLVSPITALYAAAAGLVALAAYRAFA
jgi:hypothetical protein